MKRLMKQAIHDWNNRDLAIVYIDGIVYEDATHAICLKKYLEENQIENDFGAQYRPDIEVFNEVSKLNDGQDVILAHRVDNTNEIYFIYGLKNGNNMSESEIKADLSEVYPDYEIINDLEHDDSDNHGYDEDEQVMKGYQRITDYSLGEVGESMKNKGFKLNYQYNIFYNEYCQFEFDIKKDRCCVYGVVNEVYDKYTKFKLGEMEEVADEVLPSCKEAYDVIQSCGLVFEENELINYIIFAYSKQVGNGKVTLKAAGSNEFEFEFDGFSDTETNDFVELGVEEFEKFGIDELPEKMEIIEGFSQQANLKGRLKRSN